MKTKRRIFFIYLLSAMTTIHAQQTKEIRVDEALVKRIAAIPLNSSNAYSVETMIGAPAACIPLAPLPAESWVCQWKGDITSNRITNTLSVTFEAGMISSILAIDKQGDYWVGEPGKAVKHMRP